MNKIKNIAIIAHVDHGKTTLVDAMLKQSGIFRSNQEVAERIMDSDKLEREKGITIFSKNASFDYNGYKINIVDTPGHADFGGEVQRILKMVDGVLLLVDAVEGPLPQTKYVLQKALEENLKTIVVINKIDRANSRPKEVLDLIYELFFDIHTEESQLDFPVVYASAKNGLAKYNIEDESDNIKPLLDTIIKYIPDTAGDSDKPLQMLISATEYDNYVGKIGTGKIHNGKIKLNDKVALLKKDGTQKNFNITKIYTYQGLRKKELQEASAGDIVSIAGVSEVDIGETIADINDPKPLPLIRIDQPTVSMAFLVNDSPFSGQEGKYVTTRFLWERLLKERHSNVSLKIERTESNDQFIVKGRGELQLAILIENMRREGYEFQVSKPTVIYREIDGKKTEPIEYAVIDVQSEYCGVVIEKLGIRKAVMKNMVQSSDGYTRLEFLLPARGLIGFKNEFLTDTRGTGILNHSFYEYEFYKGDIPLKKHGSLIAMEAGTATSYALNNIQDRGRLFIEPGENVYAGMVIGENSKETDIVVNVCKTKRLTNMRAAGSEDAIKLEPALKFSLEQAIEYIKDDEYLEITPSLIRIRKKILSENARKQKLKKSS